MSDAESQPQEFHGSVQIQPETDRATEAGQRLRRALDELAGAVPDECPECRGSGRVRPLTPEEIAEQTAMTIDSLKSPDTGQSREPDECGHSAKECHDVMVSGSRCCIACVGHRSRPSGDTELVSVPRVQLREWAGLLLNLATHSIEGLNAKDISRDTAGRLAWWAERPSGDTVPAVAAPCPQHPPIPGHGDELITVPGVDCPTCH